MLDWLTSLGAESIALVLMIRDCFLHVFAWRKRPGCLGMCRCISEMMDSEVSEELELFESSLLSYL